MTLDEAIKHAEEVADKKEREKQKWERWLETDSDHRAVTEKVSCELCAEDHRQLAEWLKELKQLREQTTWIPVSERLPKRTGEYFVTVIDDSGEDNYYKAVGVAWFAHKKDYDIKESEWREVRIDEKVIAWMPKPTPYEPQERSDKE